MNELNETLCYKKYFPTRFWSLKESPQRWESIVCWTLTYGKCTGSEKASARLLFWLGTHFSATRRNLVRLTSLFLPMCSKASSALWRMSYFSSIIKREALPQTFSNILYKNGTIFKSLKGDRKLASSAELWDDRSHRTAKRLLTWDFYYWAASELWAREERHFRCWGQIVRSHNISKLRRDSAQKKPFSCLVAIWL